MNYKLIDDKLDGWRGDAALYELSQEVPFSGIKEGHTKYVIVSAVDAMFDGAETYIFPATPDGETICMGEMTGSYRGGYDHKTALDSLCEATDKEFRQ